MNLIEQNIDSIRVLCVKHKVKNLFVFGSALSNSFHDKSDVDLVVDFNPISLETYADNYFDLKEKLEAIFKRSVDLLEAGAIKNPFVKAQIEREKKLIYG
jgi:predicted nucleotidyltransferase